MFNTNNLNNESHHCSWLITCKKCRRVISLDQNNITHGILYSILILECFINSNAENITETDVNNDIDTLKKNKSSNKSKGKKRKTLYNNILYL